MLSFNYDSEVFFPDFYLKPAQICVCPHPLSDSADFPLSLLYQLISRQHINPPNQLIALTPPPLSQQSATLAPMKASCIFRSGYYRGQRVALKKINAAKITLNRGLLLGEAHIRGR